MENIAYINRRLPVQLTNALSELAKKYQTQGVHLFIFGSFARKEDKRTSDLDLGALWENEPSKRIFTELYEDVQQLPTVRKIDLVNMATTDEEFKANALKNVISLKQMKRRDGKRMSFP